MEGLYSGEKKKKMFSIKSVGKLFLWRTLNLCDEGLSACLVGGTMVPYLLHIIISPRLRAAISLYSCLCALHKVKSECCYFFF